MLRTRFAGGTEVGFPIGCLFRARWTARVEALGAVPWAIFSVLPVQFPESNCDGS